MEDPASCISWVSCDPNNKIIRVICQPQNPGNTLGVVITVVNVVVNVVVANVTGDVVGDDGAVVNIVVVVFWFSRARYRHQ